MRLVTPLQHRHSFDDTPNATLGQAVVSRKITYGPASPARLCQRLPRSLIGWRARLRWSSGWRAPPSCRRQLLNSAVSAALAGARLSPTSPRARIADKTPAARRDRAISPDLRVDARRGRLTILDAMTPTRAMSGSCPRRPSRDHWRSRRSCRSGSSHNRRGTDRACSPTSALLPPGCPKTDDADENFRLSSTPTLTHGAGHPPAWRLQFIDNYIATRIMALVRASLDDSDRPRARHIDTRPPTIRARASGCQPIGNRQSASTAVADAAPSASPNRWMHR